MEEKMGTLIISGEEFCLEFDRIQGTISRYEFAGETLIKKGMGMNFWRAPVDNDKNVRKIWEEGMLKPVCNIVDKISVEEGEGNVEIKIKQM